MPCVQKAVLLANDRERSVIGEFLLAKLPNVRGRSRTQMLTKRTAGLNAVLSSDFLFYQAM